MNYGRIPQTIPHEFHEWRGKGKGGGGFDDLRCRFFQFVILQFPVNSRKQIINLVGLSGIIKFEKGSNNSKKIIAKMVTTFAFSH